MTRTTFAPIDWDYVANWCGVWQVTDRLENLRRTIAEDTATRDSQLATRNSQLT